MGGGSERQRNIKGQLEKGEKGRQTHRHTDRHTHVLRKMEVTKCCLQNRRISTKVQCCFIIQRSYDKAMVFYYAPAVSIQHYFVDRICGEKQVYRVIDKSNIGHKHIHLTALSICLPYTHPVIQTLAPRNATRCIRIKSSKVTKLP